MTRDEAHKYLVTYDQQLIRVLNLLNSDGLNGDAEAIDDYGYAMNEMITKLSDDTSEPASA
jgi:hypothetical protein